jgi:hypothetical protein
MDASAHVLSRALVSQSASRCALVLAVTLFVLDAITVLTVGFVYVVIT